jgi:gamma-glutamyltranspeptidase / glutathione hydrolase
VASVSSTIHYAVGPASCAVPGIPAGLAALHEAGGRLPWRRLVEPAISIAARGVALLPRHALCLAMLEPVFARGRGAQLYAPEGRLLGDGDVLSESGLAEALACLAEEGPASAYRGSIAEALLGVDGVTLTWDDLAAYRVAWRDPARQAWHGLEVHTRGGLSGVPEQLARLPRLAGRSKTERVLALVAALESGAAGDGHTTNIVAVDGAGRACVLTTSLGLGAGAWTQWFDLHLNSMLGEKELLIGELVPGERMESMMAPTFVLDSVGPALAIGAAGGSRLRTALVSVLAGIVDEELDPAAAIERPRVHPVGRTVHAEPGVDEPALEQLEEQGRDVVRWDSIHHYFGGVSCVGKGGAAGDPRRDGHGITVA